MFWHLSFTNKKECNPPTFWEDCWQMKRWWRLGRDPIACGSHVPDESVRTSKHRITPSSPPLPVFVVTIPLCAFVGVCEREKQCCPAAPEHYSGCGGEKGAWKEEGWVAFRPVWSFPSKQCVGRPSEAHRHAIPSPTDIMLHQQHRGDAVGWQGRGEEDWTEELFRLRRDKDGGGRCKGDVGSLATGQTIQMRLPFLKLKHNGTTPACQGRAERRANICQ